MAFSRSKRNVALPLKETESRQTLTQKFSHEDIYHSKNMDQSRHAIEPDQALSITKNIEMGQLKQQKNKQKTVCAA